jgi:tetratricopeptide (TPR) repeat protein
MNIRMFPNRSNSAQSSHPSSASLAASPVRPQRTGTRRLKSTHALPSTTTALTPSDRDLLLRRQALDFAQQGDYDSAIVLFDALIEHTPTNASHYNNRGLIHFQNGDIEAALDDYDCALQLNPNLAKVYNNRANCYIALGELEAAITDYETAIDLNPTNLHALINQGITYRELGQYELALENFDFALHLCKLLDGADLAKPDLEGHLYAERGRTRHLTGDWNCAIADYRRALTKLPLVDAPLAHASDRLRQQVASWLNSLLRPLSA